MEINEIKTGENFNRGTRIGSDIIRKSLKEFGFGRSIVIDRNNKVLCGEKVFLEASKLGCKKILLVESTGDELVVVKRVDIDSDSKRGKDFIFADNISQSKNLDWDVNKLLEVMNTYWGFDPRDWGYDISLEKELTIEDFFTEVENMRVNKPKEETLNTINQLLLFN